MTNHANFFSHLEQAMQKDPHKVAFRLPAEGRDYSFADLSRLVNLAAAALLELGVDPGERVLAQVDKSVECVALYLGCLQIGAIYVPINTAYTVPEVEYFMGDSEPSLFVCQPEHEASYTDSAAKASCAVATLGILGDGSFGDRLCNIQEPHTAVAARQAQDTAAILYTSGTTGRSKGAMLTHHNLRSNAHTMNEYWGWKSQDVLLHALPIFHVHGLFVALHCSILGGSTTLFLPSFEVQAVLAVVPQATVMMGVPTFYSRLLGAKEFDSELCRDMRLFISGSAPLTEQTFTEFEQRVGKKILERYGMSETLMLTSNPLDGDRIAGTVGFALPQVSARVADAAGVELARGEVGIIEVKGPNIFSGYWRMPEKTAAEFRADGYFITGDMGVMNDEGRISIVGREKDLVISGGYNVYPKEVERLLDEMPGVLESAVIGLPHKDFGEAVTAVIVPTGEAIEIAGVKQYLGDQLAKYKQPKAVFNLSELPRNAMGKVQKNALRKRYEETFS